MNSRNKFNNTARAIGNVNKKFVSVIKKIDCRSSILPSGSHQRYC